MNYNQQKRDNSIGTSSGTFDSDGRSPMSRRSPSILVTDSRSIKKRSNAPFAGHAATSDARGLISTHLRKHTPSAPFGNQNNGRKSMNQGKSKVKRKPFGQFSEISLDNILSNSSAIPSGRREERRSISSMDRYSINEKLRVTSNYRKMINPLPSRKSKISQKLVLIPEEISSSDSLYSNANDLNDIRRLSNGFNCASDKYKKSAKDKKNLARLTAYNVAEGFNLKLISKFLKETHEVSPRLYDDCLYVPYVLPLLPGKDGFRIKSNVSKKVVGGKTLIDKLIDRSERRDHHYEYYSGVETLEDMNNNYELESNTQDNKNDQDAVIPDHLPPQLSNNPDAFNPGEPQFFSVGNNIENEQANTSIDSSVGAPAADVASYKTNSEVSSLLDKPDEVKTSNNASNSSLLLNQVENRHAEIFIFHYGVIVFWNFTETQEKNILGDITFSEYKNMILRPLDEQDIEIEEFHFEYDMDTERPRIFNDILTLRSGDHIIKLTLSYAIAQSSKLSRFESRISPILTAVTKLPKRLALYGTLGLKREQLLRKSGKLFKLRVDVNLSSSVLDTPDFFWSIEPSLHPLYVAMREYLEIDKRVQVVNDRCKVFLEFFDICVDSVAERNMARVTWWFIIVVLLGVLFSLSEILVRYNVIHKYK